MKTEAKRRANNKYDLAHYSVIGCKLRKEDAEVFKEACKAAGTTPNAVFKEAIFNFMASGAADLERQKANSKEKGEEKKEAPQARQLVSETRYY